MRILLCTSGGRPGAAVLRALRASARVQIAGVVRSIRLLPVAQYVRSGPRYTAYLASCYLHALPNGGIPVHSTRDINDAASRAFIERLAPELVVSAYFNQRIGDWLPAVNIHPSLLPALRGVDPVFYARLRDAPLGVTVHRVAPELDAGDIIAQRRAGTILGESVLAGTVRLYALGASLLLESLDALQDAKPQRGTASYDSWPTRADVRALRAKGISLARLRDLRAPAP